MPLRGPAGSRLDEFEDADAEPGLALLSAGALAHAFLSAKGALARRLQRPRHERFGEGLALASAGAALRVATPDGIGLTPGADATAPRASRSTIFSPSMHEASPALARDVVSSARPSPIDSPGAKLAAEMLVRKASLVTHARRLAQGDHRRGRVRGRCRGRGAYRAGAADGRGGGAPRRCRRSRRSARGGMRRRDARGGAAKARRQSRGAAQDRPAPGEGGAAEALRQPHLSASPAHAAFRAAPPARAGGERGRARAECEAARGRARGFRRARRDHECEARTGRHALRARAGAGHEILARHQPRR